MKIALSSANFLDFWLLFFAPAFLDIHATSAYICMYVCVYMCVFIFILISRLSCRLSRQVFQFTLPNLVDEKVKAQPSRANFREDAMPTMF